MKSLNQLRREYLPNLTEYLACCTAIYQKITYRLPQSYVLGEVFDLPIGHFANLKVVVQERHKYTDLLTVHLEWVKPSPWLNTIVIHLRLYHDMRIAEVVGYNAFDKLINLRSRDDSNRSLSYPIEKRQIHQLLFEWLSLSF